MAGEKTEAPTPKKRREGRKDGQIAKSQELTSWAGLLVSTLLIQDLIGTINRAMQGLWMDVGSMIARPDQAAALGIFAGGLRGAYAAILPLVLTLMLLGVVGNIAQVGWAPSAKPITPKFSKVSLKSGVKRLFSPQSLWTGLKDLLKVVVIASVAWSPVAGITQALMASGQPAIEDLVVVVGRAALNLGRNVALAGLVLGMADYAFQKKRINKTLKMTKQDVRDEYRQSEGDPQMKGQIRSRRMSMGRNRMIAEVAAADAIIVNPTHVAVALRYQPELGAPRVVAKGAGAIAKRIREEAALHRVPIVQDKPLARTLYKVCDVGREIPGDLYEAVARLLAFVFALRSTGKVGGIHHQSKSLV